MREDILQFMADHALEIVMAFDGDGTVTYANETAERGLEYPGGLRGQSIASVFPGDFESEGGAASAGFVPGEEIREMTAYRGNRTCFEVRARIMRCEGTPTAFVCLAYDRSTQNLLERKIVQAGQEAEAALKVKSEFVANVTHELRTPVNGILGNTRELMAIETGEEQMRLLRLVERGCNDMHAIINNILDFSKLEAGKFTLELREFNLRGMIDYVKSNHINKITEKGLEFFVTISPEVPEVVIGDELRIVQILNNLLSNACKFTSVGKIMLEVVKTAQVGNRIELFFIVIDSGIGIAPEDLDKLFKSFSQVDATISRKYGGTGLGLNISKQLVELMDGNIRVESEVGKGSMFSFHIWVEVPAGEEGRAPEAGDAPAPVLIEHLSDFEEDKGMLTYGSEENAEEIRKKMSKLILCMEMENWEKAEMFAESLKELTAGAPGPVKSASLRLKMAVQKGDYEKSKAAYEKLQGVMAEQGAAE